MYVLSAALLLFVVRITDQLNLPDPEIAALYDLYNATNGGNWTWTSSLGARWDFAAADANPCTDHWQGINCSLPSPTAAYYYTTQLELAEMNLKGTIPTSMDAFTQLKLLDFAKNQISGTIPQNLGNLSNLQTLSVTSCDLSGSIPATIGNLTQLTYLALAYNHLNGTIPDSLGNLQNLKKFYVEYNLLTGSIPNTFGQLLQLTNFASSNNLLNGTIPAALVNLPALTEFYCSFNSLSGTLPAITNAASNINMYIVSSNNLRGRLPPSLFTLSRLEFLNTDYNYLTGTIPNTVGENTPYLEYLDVSVNMLSGPLPIGLSQLSYLYVLELDTNALSGRVDDVMWELPYLGYVDYSLNHLSGSLPNTIGQQYSLQGVSIGGNQFTGTVPSNISGLYYLSYLDLYDNQLTGSMPASMGDMVYLQDLYMSNNQLTGTIPATFGGMYYLTYFDLDSNFLHGTIPAALSNLSYLTVIDFNQNLFEGYLPDMTNMVSLTEILLQHNYFEGHLYGKFNAATQPYLSIIDLNRNSFTGTLPLELFSLQGLTVLSAIRNCFHGTLPDAICSRKGLVTLALDGLSSADSCRHNIFPGLSGSYIVARSLGGTVPPCLFTMPSLNALHLSGNGLTGTLPDQAISPLLVDLSVSHNVLTGTVPEQVQRKKWYNLDLSYNRLSGTLRTDFASERFNQTLIDELSASLGFQLTSADSQSKLSLENNRLSGHIPASLRAVQNISILGTNMFSCDLAESDLPRHDSGRGTYQCGSDSFDVPYYVWLALTFVCVAVAGFAWHYRQTLQAQTQQQEGRVHAAVAAEVVQWFAVLQKVLHSAEFAPRTAHLRVVFSLCDFFSHTSLVCMALLVLLFVPLYAALSHYYSTTTYDYAWSVSAAFLSGVTPLVLLMLALMLLQGVVCACFMRQQARSSPATASEGSALADNTTAAATKPRLRWQDVLDRAVIYSFFVTMNLVCVVGANAAYVYVAIYKDSSYLFVAQLMLSCFKLLWNRFFSVYAIRWVAQQRNAKSNGQRSYVTMQMVVALLNNIVIPCAVVAVISPSCFYNIFVPSPEVDTVVVYKACTQIAANQCITYNSGLAHMPYRPPFAYNYQCSSSMVTYYAPAFVILCIVRTFATPLLQYVLFFSHQHTTPGTYAHTLFDVVLPPVLKPLSADSTHKPTSNIYQPYFDANQLLLSLVTYLGILLTFGAVFPPLAVALVVTLLSVVLLNQLKLGRFLSAVLDQQRMEYLDLVERECTKVGFAKIPRRALWMLVTVSCWFYTLFLFDTLGDAVGFYHAYWVLIVMPLMPAVLYLCCTVYSTYVNTVQSIHNMDKSIDVASGDTFNVLRESTLELTSLGNISSNQV